MDLALTVAMLVGGLLLIVWWVARVRGAAGRRAGRSADWEGLEDEGGDLWTSAARCPECRASGALLSREDDVLWHTCMACGHRHQRDNRG